MRLNFRHKIIGVFIVNRCSKRDLNVEVVSLGTCSLSTFTRLTGLSAIARLKPKIYQCVEGFVPDKVHMATHSAIAPVGTSVLNVLLPTKTKTSIASATSLNTNRRFINKLHGSSLLAVRFSGLRFVMRKKKPCRWAGFP